MAKVASVFFAVKSGRESKNDVQHGRARARVTMRGTVAFDSTTTGESQTSEYSVVIVSPSAASSGSVAARLWRFPCMRHRRCAKKSEMFGKSKQLLFLAFPSQ